MGASKLFRDVKNKGASGIQAVNKVVEKAPAILNKTSDVLGKVSQVSGKILSNPLVEGFVAANPELIPAYGAAVGASKLAGQGSKLASKGAGVAGKASNVLEKVNTTMSRPQAVTFA